MTICYPTLDILMDFGSGPVSIAADVLTLRSPFHASWGQTACDPLTRIASAGTFMFSLNNSQYNSASKLGYYSPANSNLRSGFGLETPVIFVATYGGTTKYKRFYVSQITPTPGVYGSRQVDIVASDFMGRTAVQNITGLAVQVNKRTDQGLTTLIGLMPIQPLANAYSVGVDGPLDYLFTDITDGTSFMTAIQHLALTDGGYVFPKGDAGPLLGSDTTITDGGFESWIDSSHLTNWTIASGGILQEPTIKYSGNYSVKIVNNSTITQTIPTLVAGKTYLITCWLSIHDDLAGIAIGTVANPYMWQPTGLSAPNSGLYTWSYVANGTENLVTLWHSFLGYAYFDAVSIKPQGGGETLCYQTRQERQLLSSALTLNGTMTDLAMPISENQILNDITVSCFPGQVGSSPETLYQSQKEILVRAGATVNFQANYTDPSAGNGSPSQVVLLPGSGVAPVSGTDYKVTNTSGSGQNDQGTVWGPDGTVADGGMELWTDASNLLRWTKSASSLAQEGTIKYAGSYSAKLGDNTNPFRYIYEPIAALISGKTYLISAWINPGTAGAFLQLQNSVSGVVWTSPTVPAGAAAGIYSWSYTALGTEVFLICYSSSAGYAYFDAVSVQPYVAVLTVNITWNGPYASVSLINNSTTFDVYVSPFNLRGQIIRLYNQQNVRIQDTPANYAEYGDRPLSYSMPYSDNVNFANDMANHWLSMWHLPTSIPQYIEFIANNDTTQMAAAVSLDIGSRFTAAETVTLPSSDWCIVGIDMTVESGSKLTVRYYVEPVSLLPMCILDNATYDILDSVVCLVGF